MIFNIHNRTSIFVSGYRNYISGAFTYFITLTIHRIVSNFYGGPCVPSMLNLLLVSRCNFFFFFLSTIHLPRFCRGLLIFYTHCDTACKVYNNCITRVRFSLEPRSSDMPHTCFRPNPRYRSAEAACPERKNTSGGKKLKNTESTENHGGPGGDTRHKVKTERRKK